VNISTKRVVVDRPFLYVIHDVATATPLFIGRVDDPSHVAE
jgi:serpin B